MNPSKTKMDVGQIPHNPNNENTIITIKQILKNAMRLTN